MKREAFRSHSSWTVARADPGLTPAVPFRLTPKVVILAESYVYIHCQDQQRRVGGVTPYLYHGKTLNRGIYGKRICGRGWPKVHNPFRRIPKMAVKPQHAATKPILSSHTEARSRKIPPTTNAFIASNACNIIN